MIVDTHCHVSPVWFEPMETLLSVMDRNNVGQAVLTQLIGQYDNTYQQDCIARYPDRFASVVMIDPARHESATVLERLAGEGASGVRLRPDARSPGGDPLAIWKTAERLGMVVSCFGILEVLADDNFTSLVEALPNLTIVIEHLAGLTKPENIRTSGERILALSRYANLYLKVPGLGELLPRPSPLPSNGFPFGNTIPAILNDVLDRFGAQRLMWGSDFPPVAFREGYAHALAGVKGAFEALPSTDRAAILGGNAQHIFKLTTRAVTSDPNGDQKT
jgi:L-fuconolactonase